MWPRFCQTLGLDDLIEHPDYATRAARLKNRAVLTGLIEDKTMARDTADWVARLTEAEVPCGPILSIDQSFADAQVRHLGIAQEVVSDALGPLALLGQPVRLSRTPSALLSAAPEAGEHSESVLAELGYSSDEIAELRDRQVI